MKTKKKQMEHFFPQIQVKTKKKVFIKNRTLFSPHSGEDQTKKEVFNKNRTLFSTNLRSNVYPFKLLGGMQMWTILKLLGGIQPNYWGGYIPPFPLVSEPLHRTSLTFPSLAYQNQNLFVGVKKHVQPIKLSFM